MTRATPQAMLPGGSIVFAVTLETLLLRAIGIWFDDPTTTNNNRFYLKTNDRTRITTCHKMLQATYADPSMVGNSSTIHN